MSVASGEAGDKESLGAVRTLCSTWSREDEPVGGYPLTSRNNAAHRGWRGEGSVKKEESPNTQEGKGSLRRGKEDEGVRIDLRLLWGCIVSRGDGQTLADLPTGHESV